jgi:hypothetical protein
MQSLRGNIKLLRTSSPELRGICPGQGDDQGVSSRSVRKAQNGMQDTWEIFTLRMRTSHRPTASYRQSPVAWESAK